MAVERLSRVVTFRLTCDVCGKVATEAVDSSELNGLPAPWFEFVGPSRTYSLEDGKVVLACGEPCAVTAATGELKALVARDVVPA